MVYDSSLASRTRSLKFRGREITGAGIAWQPKTLSLFGNTQKLKGRQDQVRVSGSKLHVHTLAFSGTDLGFRV